MPLTEGTIRGKTRGDRRGTLGANKWWHSLKRAGVLPGLVCDFAYGEAGRYMRNGVECAFDDVMFCVRASDATYQSNAGRTVTVGANVPRFNHIGESLHNTGIMIEATTLIVNVYTRDFAGWITATGAWHSPAVSLDGSTRNIMLHDDSTGGKLYRTYSLPGSLGNTAVYVASCFIPVTTGTPTHWPAFQMTFSGGTTQDAGIVLNTTTGVLGTKASRDGYDWIRSTREGNMWRISMAMTNNGTGNTTLDLLCSPAWNADGGTEGVVTALGNTIFDAVQCEKSKTLGSVVHVDGGAQVTRLREKIEAVPDGSLPHFGYSHAANTFVIEFRGRSTDGTNQQMISYNLDTGSRFDLYTTGTTPLLYMVNAGGPSINDGLGLFSNWTEWQKIAVAHNEVDFMATLRGTSVQMFPGRAVSTAIDRMVFGEHPSGVNLVQGMEIKRFISWPAYLNAVELKELVE